VSEGHADSAAVPAGRETLTTRQLLRLFLRTWPFLKPEWKHIVGWFSLQFLSGVVVSLLMVLLLDVLNNKVLLGEPLEPLQADLMLLDDSYVAVSELSDEQRRAVRLRMIIYTVIGYLLLVVLIQRMVTTYYEMWIAQRVNQNLRATMVANAENLSLRFHDSAKTGDIIYRVYQDSAMITNIIDTVILDPINMLWSCFFAFFILWLFSPWLGLLLLAVAVPVVLVVGWFTPRLRRRSLDARNTNSDLTSRIQEIAASIRVIKANQAEERVIGRFDLESHAALDNAFRLRVELLVMLALVAFAVGLGVVIGDYVMSAWTIDADATFLGGSFAIVGFAAWNLGAFEAARNRGAEYYFWGFALISKWSLMQDMGIGLERAFYLLDQAPDVDDKQDALDMPAPVERVEFRDVRFGYAVETPILNSVSLTATAGSITAIVGGTGSGKSTLMSLLLRLYDPDAGAVYVNGVDLRDIRLADLRGNAAIALQQNVLFAASVRDNIAYAMGKVDHEAVVSAAKVAAAHDFIEALPHGYDTELGERGARLSAGQRQRITIARAVVRDTPILILDEPTASLDAQTEHDVLQNLAEWGRDRVVFLVTHRLSTIRKADQIAMLADGRIAEFGTHETLMAIADGLYRRFVDEESVGSG
jgi:ABC-type multidrug transport system fused ATPase/permease subunit